ncbi:GntR family transcriptional regulator [Ideonella azotifigens]|uniref:GntR family transcriptional regulator n=1 Tax=Ideonella azotifigens TaxID=513160 RepID=A0ABN1K7U4_9BURK|nr:GntR family transcriptional regulator [Ideonella azotifigens]MCD2345004.1 GntR family transcriptional regulator [Ideonella azotifigens]
MTEDPPAASGRDAAAESATGPLWSQVKQSLLRMISDNGMGANAALPSESALCERFGVSRTVVREALNQLVYEHVIYKRQGKGAFVSGRREEQNFVGSIVGFSGELLDKHKRITRRVLTQRVALPGERAQHFLRLPVDQGIASQVVEVSRVQMVDGIPRILVRHSIPAALTPGLDQLPLQTRSLYDVLQKQYGMIFKRADRWIEAVTPTPEEADLLEIPHTSPLLAIESCALSDAGLPIEYYRALFRTDLASLHIRIG